MKNNKKILIIFIIITIIIIFTFFYFYMAKKNKFGNNINSQEMVTNILNLTSYEATIEVDVKSNKNTNKYIIKQKYKSPNYIEQEVLEPTNIKGVKIINKDNQLSIENTQLNLKTIYENYSYLSENDMDLISFINEYKEQNSNNCQEEKDTIIMKTKNKVLYIDKKSGKPLKMQIEDANKNIAVYILYREVNVNR